MQIRTDGKTDQWHEDNAHAEREDSRAELPIQRAAPGGGEGIDGF
jgi:hypothetical protein